MQLMASACFIRQPPSEPKSAGDEMNQTPSQLLVLFVESLTRRNLLISDEPWHSQALLFLAVDTLPLSMRLPNRSKLVCLLVASKYPSFLINFAGGNRDVIRSSTCLEVEDQPCAVVQYSVKQRTNSPPSQSSSGCT